MWPRFGIKIGNSTLCVASAKEDEKIEVIANKHGDRVSQAVLLLSDGEEIEVGLTAKQKMPSKPSCAIANSFQLFSTNLDISQINEAIKFIPCEFNKETREFELQTPLETIKKLSPYDVCVEFFKASFELARQCHISEEHPSIVLAIPYYYPSECWEELSKAAEEAGFYVSQVISEPTAAILAYEIGKNSSTTTRALCIKSGGLKTSFTLYEIEDDLYTIINSAGPFYIGGRQFTEVLIEFIATEFYKKYKLDPRESKRSMVKIAAAAENCKHILTTLPSTQIYIDSLMQGVDFSVQMSRARFENLIQPVLNEFSVTIATANNKMNINGENNKIDEVVLIGATMKIPRLQSLITTQYPNGKLHTSFPPDEVVAIGCARQSLYINSEEKELESHMECFSLIYDIYIRYGINIKKEKLIVEKGTILPYETTIDLNNDEIEDENDLEDNETIFHVKSGNQIDEIRLIGKKTNEIFRLLAKIVENNGYPCVKLTAV